MQWQPDNADTFDQNSPLLPALRSGTASLVHLSSGAESGSESSTVGPEGGLFLLGTVLVLAGLLVAFGDRLSAALVAA